MEQTELSKLDAVSQCISYFILCAISQYFYQNTLLLSKISMNQKLKKVIQVDSEKSHQEDKEYLNDLHQLDRQVEITKQIIQYKRKLRKLNHKVVVGSGFSFDITEFFHFKKTEETGHQTIFDEMEGKSIAWIILFYSVCNASLIPSYMAHIDACAYLKGCWRFFVQTLLILPFAFYQYRVSSLEERKKYQLSHVLNLENLRLVLMSALGTSFWFCLIFECFKWTYASHVLVLGSLSNFFLSLARSKRGKSNQLESGGQVLIILSICLIVFDSFMLLYEDVDRYSEYKATYFMEKNFYQNIFFDLLALMVAFCMAKLSTHTANLKTVFPPYFSMVVVNSTVCIIMALCAYFFLGATFNSDPTYGVFNIFSQEHFSTFLYLSVILNLGMIISFVMLTRLFPDQIIPALGMTFEPFFSACFFEISGVQKLPGSFAIMGYTIMVPGKILILLGNWINQKKLIKEQRQQEGRLASLSERSQRYLSKIQQFEKRQYTFQTKRKNSRVFSSRTQKMENKMKIYENEDIFSIQNSLNKQSSHDSEQ